MPTRSSDPIAALAGEFDKDPKALALDLLRFVDASPTPYHCVAECTRRLEAAGFSALDEADRWALSAGDRRFVVRGDGSLVAFRMGSISPDEGGFRLVGAHTDSPNLRLKPRPGKKSHGYLQLEVEPYGGVLLATWPDRDLGIAGRIFVDDGVGLRSKLVRLTDFICRIPNLAIHLNRGVNDSGLVLNKHKHLAPVLGPWDGPGAPEAAVLALVADAAEVAPESILGFDLCLFDVQPGAFSGLDDAFLQTARLDNQGMCHAGLVALLAAVALEDDGPVAAETAVLTLFDHEECGSQSTRGADGSLLTDILGRLVGPKPEALQRAAARSVQISADMAHGVHPNYGDLHDGTHMPMMNAGPVIKTNNNQRYATDGETSAIFRRLCRRCEVPVQEFVNRPDLGCGTTIGPISAARLGIKTVDVGNAMWSMHSIREMAGSRDHAWMTHVMAAFLAGA